VGRLKEGDRPQVYMRRLNDFELRPVQDTIGATEATFSPDGEWLFVNIQVPGITCAITGDWASLGL
jgi:secreted PhoX family phosphatase